MSACKPAIPALPRSWGLPPAPKSGTSYSRFALLALTFSNVPSPPASAIASFYAGGAFQTFITGASSGCASYTIDGFAVPLGIAEKRNDGTCTIVHSEDLPNNIQTNGSFVAANYDSIIMMVVNDECATSGSSGNGVRTINGVSVTSNFLFNSVRASVVQQSSCSGWSCPLPVSQLSMVHELLHTFRYQQHSNAYQCLSEPSNTLKCTMYEYGDIFDIVGGAKLLAGFRARARYYLGWFGSDEVLGVTSAGTHSIGALNAPMAAVPSVGSSKRAAFVRTPAGSTEADGIWVEFIGSGAGNTWNNGSYAGVAYNQAGLFLQKGGYLIDATRQRCGGGAYADSEAWQDEEMVKVTLNAGKTFVDQTTGIKLSKVSPSPDGLSVSFTVEYGLIDTTCYRALPRIGAGLFGEYQLLMDGSCSSCETQSLIDELKAVSSVAGAPRKGYWKVSQAEDVDEGSCGQSSTFALDVVDLPAGWGKVSYYGDVVSAGRTMWAGSTPSGNFHFALTIPQDAANGTYDMCVLVYNRVSGLQTAKPFRVTLPESGWQFWTNNRPDQYSPAPANNCSQYVTCRTGIAGCTAPIAKQGICEREAQADEPGCSPRSAATVTVTLVAAGSVSDYNETTKTNLQIKFAEAAGVRAASTLSFPTHPHYLVTPCLVTSTPYISPPPLTHPPITPQSGAPVLCRCQCRCRLCDHHSCHSGSRRLHRLRHHERSRHHTWLDFGRQLLPRNHRHFSANIHDHRQHSRHWQFARPSSRARPRSRPWRLPRALCSVCVHQVAQGHGA